MPYTPEHQRFPTVSQNSKYRQKYARPQQFAFATIIVVPTNPTPKLFVSTKVASVSSQDAKNPLSDEKFRQKFDRLVKTADQ